MPCNAKGVEKKHKSTHKPSNAPLIRSADETKSMDQGTAHCAVPSQPACKGHCRLLERWCSVSLCSIPLPLSTSYRVNKSTADGPVQIALPPWYSTHCRCINCCAAATLGCFYLFCAYYDLGAYTRKAVARSGYMCPHS